MLIILTAWATVTSTLDSSSHILEHFDVEVLFSIWSPKMYQSSIIRPCSDFSAVFSPLYSATEGVQVHFDLLPSAHHAYGGVQAPHR